MKDKYLKYYDYISVNKKRYYFKAEYVIQRKAINYDGFGLELAIKVYTKEDGFRKWQDFKGTYVAEKICDYIENTINGQRAIYWNNNVEPRFRD